jgi:histidyl-tRNA synthetase
MYVFQDLGERRMALKPEGTAPAMRAFLERRLGEAGLPVKLWYFTPFFRYEAPQKGRQRQAHQFGLELIGSDSPAADAEVIELTSLFYRSFGLEGITVRLNSIGRAETRARYREAILAHIDGWLKDQSEGDRAKALRNPLRLFDRKEEDVQRMMADAPLVTDCLEEDSRRSFEELQDLLAESQTPFELDPRIVRGLDYYTDTVFEIQSSALGSQSALCGGGRYDGLIEEIGGPPTPSVGVGMGVERLMIALAAIDGLPAPERRGAFVISITPEEAPLARRIVRELRQAGIPSQSSTDGRAMKRQFKQADRSGMPWSIILGPDEAAAGVAKLKRMETGEEESCPISGLAERLAR